MDSTNDIKIISMLGEVSQKVNDITEILKNMQERMNRNFALLAEAHETTNNKLDIANEDINEIKFNIDVLRSGVGLNANKIEMIKMQGE